MAKSWKMVKEKTWIQKQKQFIGAFKRRGDIAIGAVRGGKGGEGTSVGIFPAEPFLEFLSFWTAASADGPVVKLFCRNPVLLHIEGQCC